jgi:hypothetical protein
VVREWLRQSPGRHGGERGGEVGQAGTQAGQPASKLDVLHTEDASVTQPVAYANINAGANPSDGALSGRAGHDRAVEERGALVQLCVYAWDRARSSGVAERIEQGLASVGVSALRPDGDRFDPAQHEAGGTVRTEDPTLDGVVAETEVVGFSDRGTLLRVPVVTVYIRRTPAEAGS